MKLKEIFNTGPQKTSTIDPNDFDLTHKQQVARAEGGLPVIKATAHQNSSLVLFGITDVDNQLLCAVAGEFRTIYGAYYFVIGGAWTAPAKRRQGFMTALYLALIKHLNLKLLSDKEMSPDMFRVWDGLHKLRGTKILDIVNKKVIPRDQLSDDKLFQDTSMVDDYRLILEQADSLIPPIGEGILLDYQIVTHPDRVGEYE